MGLYTVVWGKSKDPIGSTATAPLKDDTSNGAHELPITAPTVKITTTTGTSEMSKITTT